MEKNLSLWKLRHNIEDFALTHGLLKTDKQKQQFQGPECKKVLRKLSQLREYIPQELYCFVDILEGVNEVYTISFAKDVNIEHQRITARFERLWIIAMDKHGITMPLQVYIICHHLSDFFELTGKTLRRINDQVVVCTYKNIT